MKAAQADSHETRLELHGSINMTGSALIKNQKIRISAATDFTVHHCVLLSEVLTTICKYYHINSDLSMNIPETIKITQEKKYLMVGQRLFGGRTTLAALVGMKIFDKSSDYNARVKSQHWVLQ